MVGRPAGVVPAHGRIKFGDHALEFIDRGYKTEVGTPGGGPVDSKFIGNTIEICPVGARQLGDRDDPYDPVNEILATRRVQVLQPELLTRPQCFYLGLDMEVR